MVLITFWDADKDAGRTRKSKYPKGKEQSKEKGKRSLKFRISFVMFFMYKKRMKHILNRF